MSRVGKVPIFLPDSVRAEVYEHGVRVLGSLGELFVPVPQGLAVDFQGTTLRVHNRENDPRLKPMHGTVRSLLANAVKGVSQGHTKVLLLHRPKGAYRAHLLKDGRLEPRVGFSHPVVVSPPQGVRFEVPEPTRVIILGSDKALVGQVAAQVRAVRPLSVFGYASGKSPMGIGYEQEEPSKSVIKGGGKGR